MGYHRNGYVQYACCAGPSTPATNMPPEGNLFRLKCFSFPTSTRPPHTTFTGRPDCGPLCFDDFLILHPVSAFSPSQQRLNQRKKITEMVSYITFRHRRPTDRRRRRHTTTGAHFHLPAISDYLCRANTAGPGHKIQTCAAPFRRSVVEERKKKPRAKPPLVRDLAWSYFTDVFISLPVRMCCSGQAGVCFFFCERFSLRFIFQCQCKWGGYSCAALLPLM